MNTNLQVFVAALLMTGACASLAATRYVDVNSTNATPPYTNWATAATSIYDAMDAAVAGDEIVVNYGYFGPVYVDKPITVRSLNGPQFTTIDGGGQFRCAWLNSGAALSGFTLRNGYVSAGSGGIEYGGGVRCESSTSIVSNCVIRDNQLVGDDSGGIYGGGAYGGTLNNCTLVNNSLRVRIVRVYLPPSNQYISGGGGGAAVCTLNGCTLSGNSVTATNFVDGGISTTAIAEGGGAAYVKSVMSESRRGNGKILEV